MTLVSQLPNIENYVYISNVKLIDLIATTTTTVADDTTTNVDKSVAVRQISSISKNKKMKRILFCIDSQVSITVVNNKNKRRYH